MKTPLHIALGAAVLTFALSTHGASAPDGFSALIEEAAHSTDVLQTPGGDYHLLTHLMPADRTETHTADYFSVVGFTLGGQFRPVYVSIVSEDWMKISDGWTIDQWNFQIALDGTILMAAHNSILEKDDVVITSPQPRAPTKSEASARLRKIETNWIKWVANET